MSFGFKDNDSYKKYFDIYLYILDNATKSS